MKKQFEQYQYPEKSVEGNIHTVDFRGYILDVYVLMKLAHSLSEEIVDISQFENEKNKDQQKLKSIMEIGRR